MGACWKNTYQTERAARHVAVQLKKRDGRRRFPYCCPFCRLWHLTSRLRKG